MTIAQTTDTMRETAEGLLEQAASKGADETQVIATVLSMDQENDPDMLARVHSSVYDQCQRSGQYPPYPPVLIEAHEQAVITTADRQVVSELVEQALAAQGIYYQRSAKDQSKRGRGV